MAGQAIETNTITLITAWRAQTLKLCRSFLQQLKQDLILYGYNNQHSQQLYKIFNDSQNH